MMHKLISYYGFSRMPFGRDLAPGMLHRHTAHNEAVARIGWCIADRRIGVLTGEVGSGKTVAVRAATAALDRSRPAVIYLPNPSVGMRGMLHHIVTALGHTPKFYTATLAPQAADALATRTGRTGPHPGHRGRHYRPHENPYTPFVLRDFRDVLWLFTDRVRDVRHVRAKEAVWHDQW
jgi:type II secretory pathway predicted ATPase ExeA